MLQDPRDSLGTGTQRKRNPTPTPEAPREPPHRGAGRGCYGNAPSTRAQERLERHSHPTQDAPRCLRRDATEGVATRRESIIHAIEENAGCRRLHSSPRLEAKPKWILK